MLAAPAAAGVTSLAMASSHSSVGASVSRSPRPRPATVHLTSGRSLDVLPRSTWGANHPPTAPIPAEPDVRFLLVHHTVTGNGYGTDEVAAIISGFYNFHTTDRGWPDVAYNFLVDRFGRVWEARAGSLAGAVAGDATGGNQGFDQKCAFIGDHQSEPPSPDAQSAMVMLLAWLADRHAIPTEPGSEVSFPSRGSNRWAAGAPVTTATIEGHRAMSQTACPGDAALGLVHDSFPARVTTWRGGDAPAPADPPPSSPTSTSATTVAGAQEPTGPTSSEPPSTTTDTTAATTTVTTQVTEGPAAGPDVDGDASGVIDASRPSTGGARWPWAAGTAGAVGLGALAVVIRRRATLAGTGPPAPEDDDRSG